MAVFRGLERSNERAAEQTDAADEARPDWSLAADLCVGRTMTDRDKKLFVPGRLPDHERPLGRMMADSYGSPFSPLRSLDEAKAASDGVAILQGDDGGQIYVVSPASKVACSANTLRDLLVDLDAIAWPGNPADMRRVFYERLPLGAGVAGGMGGGHVGIEPWIHEEFVRAGLQANILDVLAGRRSRIG